MIGRLECQVSRGGGTTMKTDIWSSLGHGLLKFRTLSGGWLIVGDWTTRMSGFTWWWW